MKISDIVKILKKTELFADLEDSVLQHIASSCHYHTLAMNELLIREHSSAKAIYIIVSGDFSVYKLHAHDRKNVKAELAILHPYDVVGELAFLDDLPRSTNVKALADDCSVLEISNDKLAEFAPASFYKKLSKKLTNKIRMGNNIIIDNLKHKLAQKNTLINMGHFITYVLLLISIYNLAIRSFVSLVTYPYTRMYASTFVIAIFTVGLTIMLRHMGYRLHDCGVNLKHWRESLKESLIATAIFIFMITSLKWFVINMYDTHEHPLIDFNAVIPIHNVTTSELYLWLASGMIVYAIFSCFQEFIARGVLQGTLTEFFDFKHKAFLANVVTSAVFASIHTHLSPIFALMVFVPSLLWGWLYSRYQTLIGPMVSHILIGWWAIFALGIQDLLSSYGTC